MPAENSVRRPWNSQGIPVLARLSRRAVAGSIGSARGRMISQFLLIWSLLAFTPAAAQTSEQTTPFAQAECRRLSAVVAAACARAARGEVAALLDLGRAFASGRGVERDDTLATRAFRLAADQNSAQARNELALLIGEGRGGERDPERAAELFRLAAQQGLADAQLNLAIQYQRGRGVAQDDREAAVWLERAANQGNARALTALGQAYEDARGVPHDLTRAAALYRRAAEQGHGEAQFLLGSLFQSGRGVRRDLAEAARLYRLAAAQNYAAAQNALGLLSRDGLGVVRNEVEATRLFRAAAEQGLAAAQLNLAQALERQGSMADAVRWYRAAQAGGVSQAEVEIDRVLAAIPANPSVPDPAEVAFWQSVERGNSSADYRAYLDAYPRGMFVALARARIEATLEAQRRQATEARERQERERQDRDRVVREQAERQGGRPAQCIPWTWPVRIAGRVVRVVERPEFPSDAWVHVDLQLDRQFCIRQSLPAGGNRSGNPWPAIAGPITMIRVSWERRSGPQPRALLNLHVTFSGLLSAGGMYHALDDATNVELLATEVVVSGPSR